MKERLDHGDQELRNKQGLTQEGLSQKTTDGDIADIVSGCGHNPGFDPGPGADEQDLASGPDPLKLFGYRQPRIEMPAGSPACYQQSH
jgi:hypothetical protein